MAAPNPLPTYVYKILDGPPPQESLPAELPLSELDSNDGFIHLSTAAQVYFSLSSLPLFSHLLPTSSTHHQIPATAGLFYNDHPSLWMLRIPLQGLGTVKWEGADGKGRSFPHLYGKLGSAEVESVKELKRPEAGWGALKEAWLE